MLTQAFKKNHKKKKPTPLHMVGNTFFRLIVRRELYSAIKPSRNTGIKQAALIGALNICLRSLLADRNIKQKKKRFEVGRSPSVNESFYS